MQDEIKERQSEIVSTHTRRQREEVRSEYAHSKTTAL